MSETKDALDNLIDFIFADDTPFGLEDEVDLKIFNDALEQAEMKLAKSLPSAHQEGEQ